MPFTSIVCGTLLTLIGAVGYIYALTTEKASFTALIPAFFGIVLFILGLVANAKENIRKHLMHAAVLIALVGFIGALFSPGIKGAIMSGTIKDNISFAAHA